ncbi:MAG TPA: GNAT family N-acetyltransferase [Bosea sp. (in: a-proteobacteria)]|jgi:ribosomal protein S18 acetylase RimI-like enzyme|uniref:GNAT family N-acetyltransferase n=1 Tax=Bosea sp. (in: a-proteobacteria) TaxID=1871050 RepID=UPI002E148EE6|nr:GNAT family N-acetyltransferase [Bosea sp. (in: a-proteobacteria)]
MARIQRETDTAAAREAVVGGLSAYNAAIVGARNSQPFALSLRDDADVIVGGLIGELKWEWLHIDLLWIDEAHRGKGHGEALVDMAEKAARDHGARGVYLSTMSLQAPDFYPKLGYRQCGLMEDYPVAGHRIHHFAKAL